MGIVKYRRDGLWRGIEIRREIERRTGYVVGSPTFKYWINAGVIPKGAAVTPLVSGGTGICQLWTDEQVEQIIYIVQTRIKNSHYFGKQTTRQKWEAEQARKAEEE